MILTYKYLYKLIYLWVLQYRNFTYDHAAFVIRLMITRYRQLTDIGRRIILTS